MPLLGHSGAGQDLRLFSEADGAAVIKHIQRASFPTDYFNQRPVGIQGSIKKYRALLPVPPDIPLLVAIGGARLVLLKQQVIGLLASSCDDGLLISAKL